MEFKKISRTMIDLLDNNLWDRFREYCRINNLNISQGIFSILDEKFKR